MSRVYGGVMRSDVAYATGFVVEMGLYCAYTCLFIAALPGMTNARRLKDSRTARSAWVFLSITILMYIVATLHIIFAGFRFYKSIFLNVDPKGAISYLRSAHHMEYMPLIVLFCVQTWLGDALVIYRCYFVWDSNLWVIVVPVGLLLASIVVNSMVWYQIYHPLTFPSQVGMRIFRCIYPIAFAQNFLTTSFIILKIYLQHRASKKAGVVHAGATHSLIRIIRIVIESAAIYTIELLILIILYFRRDNAQFLVQAATIPSIGITFVLLAIRIQAPKTINATSGTDLGISSTLIPEWLRNNDSDGDVDPEHDRNGGSRPGRDLTELGDVQKIDPMEEDSGAENWDTESSSAKKSRNGKLTV